MDPLSDAIALLRPNAALSKPISGRGRWGVRYQAHDAPGFTIVLAGEAWLTLAGREPLKLAVGDFLLLPTTPAFSLSSAPGIDCVAVEPVTEAVRHGVQGGEPDFVALGGSFSYEQVNAPLLLALLPDVVHIPASAGRATHLGRMIELMAEEYSSSYPGRDLIMQRLLEALLVEALRWGSLNADAAVGGLLRGMREPELARVLQKMHSNVRAKWTVAELARVAGMSRSAFAAHFAQSLGCAPIEYLMRWRMALAKSALVNGGKPLDQIADEIGYESASAFSTAFRRLHGCSPSRFARSVAG
jgi:AraC-like DNA-binding protein